MSRRAYTLRARAEREGETKSRIVEAIITLHQELGPSRTTVAAIAGRAGVQRLTVYRHFPSEESMMAACSAQWAGRNPLPDPVRWSAIRSPGERLAAALTDLYGYYQRTAPMLEKIVADAPRLESVERSLRPFGEWLDHVTTILVRGRSLRGKKKELASRTLRHAIDFTTWHSLDRQGMSTRRKVELVEQWMSAFR
jgi:AcrR family transcriptional regulator